MHLGTLRQGRKAVVFVSEALGRLGQDAIRVLSDLIRTANDNNTAIYTVDPRGLQAGGAGGSAASRRCSRRSPIRPARKRSSATTSTPALRKVVLTSSSFYLLGYSPKDTQLDGKFREIKVRVKHGGVQVRARNGYWAPRGADIDRARAIALAAALPSPVAKAFKELTPDNSRRPAEFWVGLAAGRRQRRARVNLVWAPRPGIEGRAAAGERVGHRDHAAPRSSFEGAGEGRRRFVHGAARHHPARSSRSRTAAAT